MALPARLQLKTGTRPTTDMGQSFLLLPFVTMSSKPAIPILGEFVFLTSYSLHKLLLDDLGVRQVAAVIGGSMGGMLVLEWAYFGKDYVRCIVPIATSSRHSAWCISWGEAQRQSIYADPKYDDGYYSFDDPPITGLGAARMSALLTYRSRNSFEARFGRNTPDPSKRQTITERSRSNTPSEAHFHIHNDGHKVKRGSISRQNSDHGKKAEEAAQAQAQAEAVAKSLDPQFSGPKKESITGGEKTSAPTYFSAQSYLRYQGQKFVQRFDSNCYIAITRKLDTHDVSRYRAESVPEALALIQQPTLVLGIESDGLFTFAEQREIAEHIQNARLREIVSQEGHDAFLLQFEQVNRFILEFLREVLPDIMEKEGDIGQVVSVGQLTKSSVFGEAEVEDITAW
jgi:homoserine O-acetyltransferase/O-succinyltransferase